MINAISSWASNIVIAVIIATIIEMILPDNSNKKYVKTVIGVFILFTIVSPVITKLSNEDISLDSIISNINIEKLQTKEVSTLNTDNDIEKTYINSLKSDIENKVQEKGYIAKEVNIVANMQEGENYGQIEKISFRLGKQENKENSTEISIVEQVSINLNETEKEKKLVNISKNEYEEIRNYIAQIYQIKSEIVNIY